MNINVWLHGRLGELAIRKRLVQLANGASLGDLIDWLIQEYGEELGREIERSDENFITLNGNYCKLSVDRERQLQDGDIVAFIPIIAGG